MPGPSASWGTGTVTGKYLSSIDGTAQAGTVTFTIPVRVVSVADGATFPSARFSKVVTLDGSGSFTTTLGATDDPDISPTGWQYFVTENVPGGGSYYLSVPLGATVNLDSVVTPDMFINSTPSLLRGVAGGVAGLNPSGQVVDAAGAVVGGLPANHWGIQLDSNGIPFIDTSGA